MNKSLALLAAVLGVAFAAPSFAADEKIEKKETVKATDAAGTKTKSESSIEVKKDEEGNTKEVVKTEESKDPKGLMNKEKTSTKEVTEKDAAGNVTKHSKKVDGKEVKEEAPAAGHDKH